MIPLRHALRASFTIKEIVGFAEELATVCH